MAKLRAQMHNTLTERCFDLCVKDFRYRGLDGQERACIERCVDKYLKLEQRCALRVIEQGYFQQFFTPRVPAAVSQVSHGKTPGTAGAVVPSSPKPQPPGSPKP